MAEIDSLLRFVAPLGVGGALAAFIFYFYRRDLSNGFSINKEERSMLVGAITANTEAVTILKDAVLQNREMLVRMQDFCRYRRESGQ